MADDEFTAFLHELTEPLGGISMRRMFGGLAIYRDGTVFALVIDGSLHLKADAATVAAFEAEGSRPFTYAAKGGREVRMPYWRLPERLYDDPDEFRAWCLAAVAAGRRLEAAKAAGGKRRAAAARPPG